MADISQITLPDNNVYYIKDATARSNISDLSAAMPTKTSDLTNDSSFITSSSLPVAATATPLVDGTAAVGSSAKYAREDHVHPHDTSKQDTLISGTNIKTINNTSILGSGNIPINVTAMTDAEIIAAVQTGWGVTVPQSATGVSF